jgi:hypothetical protein
MSQARPVQGRSGAGPAWTFADSEVMFAMKLLDDSRIIPTLAEARESERRRRDRHPGGAPARITERAIGVAILLAPLHGMAQQDKVYTDILFRRLSPKMRTKFGVPDPPAPDDDRGWRACERAVERRFLALIEPMDPSDLPKNRKRTPEELADAAARLRRERGLTEESIAARYELLTRVVNALLEASLRRQPAEQRERWKGSVGLDATVIPAFARQDKRAPGRARSKRAVVKHSADPDAGLYVRTDDEEGRPSSKRNRLRDIQWGYEATIAVAGSDDPTDAPAFPSLAVGMAPLHRPGADPAANAITALTSVVDRGHPQHLLGVDRAYSNCVADTFQLPARALGYQLVIDYKIDQLGVQESYAGAKLVDGAFCSAGIPDSVAYATRDFRLGRIDEETRRARIEERRAYLLRDKEKPDDQGHVRKVCPAAGGAPCAACELKPESLTKAPTKTRIPVTDELRANPPQVCKQLSVTIPPEAGAKFLQPLLHGSEEWARTYAALRNASEGMNGDIKDGAHTALDDPRRRRVRGVAAQSLFVALALVATNLRRVDAFARQARPDDKGVPRKQRPPRRRTRALGTWRPKVPARSGAPPP